MSNTKENKVATPYKPEPGEAAPSIKPQDAVEISLDTPNISLAKIRMACLQLAHSAANTVTQTLVDAETFALWVETGQKPE